MPHPLTVIDTNVVVSGLMTDQSESPPFQIVDDMLRGSFSFLLSLDLLAEYRKVLLRPKIKKRHGLSDEEVDTILTQMTTNGMMREPQGVPTKSPDPGDQHVWDLVGIHPNTVLVTGDQALRKMAGKRSTVFSPQEFVEKKFNRE